MSDSFSVRNTGLLQTHSVLEEARAGLFFLLLYNARLTIVIDASVAKLVDARDLKSLVRKDVPVRLRPEAPLKTRT